MEQPKLTNVIGTPPLSSCSGMQTDSSIQAAFAAKVAAAVGEGKKVSPRPPPKKKKQRFKDFDKKENEGFLMDAYVSKPPEPVVQEKVKAPDLFPKKVEKPSDEDLSWEDKERIPTKQTRLKYERDFLLKLQFMKICTEKPAGLPDIEVVLDAPVPQNKMGPLRGSVMSDFLPSHARQKSQLLKKSENCCTSLQERKNKLLEEEKKKPAELYRRVLAILNKLTPQTCRALVGQIMELQIDTPERLEGVIDIIFEKAICEPMFSVAHANMCRCLLQIKVSGPDDEDVTFRKLLLNRCQKEFEKETLVEKALAEQETFLEGLSEEEKKIERERMDEEASKNKRRMLGNIKFIGELFKLKLLTETIMHDCIFKLLRACDEESLESMCILLFTIGKDLDCDKAKPRMDQYFDQINKIISGKKTSSRVSFMLRDVVDLRKNKWVPRRGENSYLYNYLYDPQNKGGRRDSPKPMQSSNDGWIVSESFLSTSNVQDKIPSLTTEEMARKTKAIVDMFVLIEDTEEALNCFTALKAPEIHHVFISTAVEHMYDFDSKSRKLTGRLFNQLLFRRRLTKKQFSLGLGNVLEFAEDSAKKYPKLWYYLAEIITPVILGKQFKLAALKPLIMHLVQCNKTAVILAEILTIIAKKKGQDKAKLFWTASDISWSDVLAKDMPTREFLQQKRLTVLPSAAIDELNKLLRNQPVVNNDVFAFIEKHFKEETRKEPEFIGQLASAVAESCLINKDEEDGPDCCTRRLKGRKNILHKYLDNNHGLELELEVLFALQTLYVQHNKPAKMLLTFFNTLYDEEVITEDSFVTWKNDNNPSRQEGKRPAVQATTSFFEWMQSAAEEIHES